MPGGSFFFQETLILMPTPLIQSYAKKTGKSAKELENSWKEAEKEARDMGQGNNDAYIHGIFKNMIGIKEADFLKIKQLLFQESDFKNWKEFDTSFSDAIQSGDFTELPESPGVIKRKTGEGVGEEWENDFVPEFVQE